MKGYSWIIATILLGKTSMANIELVDPTLTKELLFEAGTILEQEMRGGEWLEKRRPGPIFNTCVDWHSSVHCHWALLRIFRKTGFHKAAAEEVNRRIQFTSLWKEMDYLDKNPSYERPYGRAWFLLLALEFESWARENDVEEADRFFRYSDALAKSLLNFYEIGRIKPEAGEYVNPGWAVLRLYDYFEHRHDYQSLQVVKRIIQKHFFQSFLIGFDSDFGGYENQFFSPFANIIYLISKVYRKTILEYFISLNKIDNQFLAVPDGKKERTAAQIWNRAWAFKELYRKTGESRFLKAFEDHFTAGVDLHEKLKHDLNYFHFVPQFMVYALTD